MDDATTKEDSEDITIHPAAVEGEAPQPVNKASFFRSKLIEQGKTVTLISDLKSGKLLPTNLDVRISQTKK